MPPRRRSTLGAGPAPDQCCASPCNARTPWGENIHQRGTSWAIAVRRQSGQTDPARPYDGRRPSCPASRPRSARPSNDDLRPLRATPSEAVARGGRRRRDVRHRHDRRCHGRDVQRPHRPRTRRSEDVDSAVPASAWTRRHLTSRGPRRLTADIVFPSSSTRTAPWPGRPTTCPPRTRSSRGLRQALDCRQRALRLDQRVGGRRERGRHRSRQAAARVIRGARGWPRSPTPTRPRRRLGVLVAPCA